MERRTQTSCLFIAISLMAMLASSLMSRLTFADLGSCFTHNNTFLGTIYDLPQPTTHVRRKLLELPDPKWVQSKDMDDWEKHCNAFFTHSLPFVSGDTFKCWADAYLDRTNAYTLDENTLKQLNSIHHRAPIIFLKPDEADLFFDRYHDRLQPYVLITHNSDFSQPWPRHLKYLDDPNLVHWFALNPLVANHSKLSPVPLGLQNRFERRALPELYLAAKEKARGHKIGDVQMVINFKPHNSDRWQVIELFQNEKWARVEKYGFMVKGKDHVDKATALGMLLGELSKYKFAVSPRGWGLDCYRTWELLAIGVVPIVKHSSLDPLFEGLPVLLVNNWTEIDEHMLHVNWGKFKHQILSRNILPGITFRFYQDKILKVAQTRGVEAAGEKYGMVRRGV